MTAPEPFRGQVWDVDFEFGSHPAVVVSVNPMNSRLGHVAVIPITGTKGPPRRTSHSMPTPASRGTMNRSPT
ncbi:MULTISPECIES: type II toxin-antitoxin system PemK/MazF family toxin [unclassified Modestobacter]